MYGSYTKYSLFLPSRLPRRLFISSYELQHTAIYCIYIFYIIEYLNTPIYQKYYQYINVHDQLNLNCTPLFVRFLRFLHIIQARHRATCEHGRPLPAPFFLGGLRIAPARLRFCLRAFPNLERPRVPSSHSVIALLGGHIGLGCSSLHYE